MFTDMSGIHVRHAAHPEAIDALSPEESADIDTVLFYDMAGIPGTGVPDGSDTEGKPSLAYRNSIESLLDHGVGIVLLNHALVSWPHWPLWRQITRTSFLLQAGELNGRHTPGSGYRGGHGPHPNPTFSVHPQQDHPVLEALGDGFEITDELYLKTDGFESSVLPLLRADYPFTSENFTAPPMASAEEQANWNHPAGSDLVVWANALNASPIVCCELGDSPTAFDNGAFRQLLKNALRWTASDEARQWALEWQAEDPGCS